MLPSLHQSSSTIALVIVHSLSLPGFTVSEKYLKILGLVWAAEVCVLCLRSKSSMEEACVDVLQPSIAIGKIIFC